MLDLSVVSSSLNSSSCGGDDFLLFITGRSEVCDFLEAVVVDDERDDVNEDEYERDVREEVNEERDDDFDDDDVREGCARFFFVFLVLFFLR